LGIGNHGKIEPRPLCLFDVEPPLVMRFDGVHRKTDRLDVAPIPFCAKFRHFAKLCRTDRREVLGMAEKQPPTGPKPVVEMDSAFSSILFEIWGSLPELDGHVRSLLIS